MILMIILRIFWLRVVFLVRGKAFMILSKRVLRLVSWCVFAVVLLERICLR